MAAQDDQPFKSSRGDLYHQGIITKLFPSNNTGVVRTENGRELTFSYDLVILCGEAKSALESESASKWGTTWAGRRVGCELRN